MKKERMAEMVGEAYKLATGRGLAFRADAYENGDTIIQARRDGGEQVSVVLRAKEWERTLSNHHYLKRRLSCL